MANYAYVRVSTSATNRKAKKVKDRYVEIEKQDYERQRFILSNSGVVFDRIFEEHVSGGKQGRQRQAFNEMLGCLKEGDTVYFTETSRFGRNYIDCFEMLDMLTLDKKVRVKFICNGIDLEAGAKMNPYMWLNLSNCLVIDEFQKRQIGYNTSNKLKALKEQGVRLGAPQTIPQEKRDEAVELKKQGFSCNAISKMLGISRTVVSKAIKIAGV